MGVCGGFCLSLAKGIGGFGRCWCRVLGARSGGLAVKQFDLWCGELEGSHYVFWEIGDFHNTFLKCIKMHME